VILHTGGAAKIFAKIKENQYKADIRVTEWFEHVCEDSGIAAAFQVNPLIVRTTKYF